MILTRAKYHENLLKDSPLSLLSVVKFFSSLETKMILKTPNETFLRITRYRSVKQVQVQAEAINQERVPLTKVAACWQSATLQ